MFYVSLCGPSKGTLRCFTSIFRQLSLICLLRISHKPMSLYTALCSTLLLRLFQDPDNVFRIFNQVYSGSKTLHISTCQIYNYVVLLVSINLDYISRLHQSQQLVQPVTAWNILVQPVTAWYSLAEPGTVWYSLVQPGTAW